VQVRGPQFRRIRPGRSSSSLTPPFVDTLTIDNPHDIDWYRFRVTLADTVTVQTRPRPLSGGVDASDIDLYLMRVSDFAQIGTDQTPGSFGKIKLFLPAGDYYLAVVDRIGVPTRYGMCIIRGVACTPRRRGPRPCWLCAGLRVDATSRRPVDR
jgi:hypothetical protein